MSFLQGERLAELLELSQRPWNAAWNHQAAAFSNEPSTTSLPGGLRITLLSPSHDELRRLAKKWDDARRKMEMRRQAEAEEEPSFEAASFSLDAEEAEDDEAPPEPVRKKAPKPPKERTSRDVEWLAQRPFRTDSSIPNLSSIAFLAEHEGTAVLIGGDARAGRLARSIAALLAQRSLKRLPLDAFVVPQAGSQRNLSIELLEQLDCRRYLFSTHGKYHLPDRVTVARILVHGRPSRGAGPLLVFNYRSEANEVWESQELQKQYRYRAIYPPPNEEGIKVALRSS